MLLELSLTAIGSSLISTLVTSAYFKKIISKHEICPVYNIFTRAALEIRWKTIDKTDLAIAFLDVDKLKQANQFYGQADCNNRLAKALSVLRGSERFEISGRFYYGDEVVIIAPVKDIMKPVKRVQDALKANGLSATIAITRYNPEHKSLTDAVKPANKIVENLKAENIRGIVYSDIYELIAEVVEISKI
ncbi:GGDEF domain-containing protein [Calothrix sp. NIES-2100]|uniref:diguanylate cyclase n=1 Tax=Calothrix sp. NIES-2100 TaxID=1954172 RepID=UPI000B61E1E1|nr:GGDEF domain-containing protein [Calothrix sp. NIES-2100]